MLCVFEWVINFYWFIYKTQLPPQFGCHDTGLNVFFSLPWLGKLLYIIRSLMIRPRKKKTGVDTIRVMTPTKKRDRYDYHYNPSNTRLFYSLITHTLQIISTNVIYIGDCEPMSEQISFDDTVIKSNLSDKQIINDWSLGDNISYMITFDSCHLPDKDRMQIQLPQDVKRSLTIQNAGGSSELSETVSMYYMYLKLHAQKFIFEMEINYQFNSPICDYIMDIGGGSFRSELGRTNENRKVGVSVTRAICYPFNQTIPFDFATSLLYKKLIGIIIAKKSVCHRYQFDSSIIHVWCHSWPDAIVIKNAYQYIIDKDIYNLYQNISIMCTVCCSDFIYTNGVGNLGPPLIPS